MKRFPVSRSCVNGPNTFLQIAAHAGHWLIEHGQGAVRREGVQKLGIAGRRQPLGSGRAVGRLHQRLGTPFPRFELKLRALLPYPRWTSPLSSSKLT